MFIRKKKNKSGVISVQVIAKQNGKSKLIKTIGSSSNENEIEELYSQGKEFIKSYGGQQSLSFKDVYTPVFDTFIIIKIHLA